MDILAKINWVDALVLILVVRTSYVSLQDGLSREILPLAGSVCMLVVSLHYYTRLAAFLYNIGFTLPMAVLNLLSFILTAVVIGILFRLIKSVIDKIIKVNWHPVIEKFGGFVAGITRGAVLTSTVLTILTLMPLPYLQWSVRDRSLTGVCFLKIGPFIYEKVYGFLPAVPANEKSPAVKK